MLATGCASFISEPLSLFSPLCKLSYSESCNKTLTWQEGCCTASDVVVKCCCRVVFANHYYSLADRVCQLKDWLWRWLHFMWPQGRKQGQQCESTPGIRSRNSMNLMVWGTAWLYPQEMSKGLGHWPQQRGETAFSRGLQACLGLVWSPQKPWKPKQQRVLNIQWSKISYFSLNPTLNSNVFVSFLKVTEKKSVLPGS